MSKARDKAVAKITAQFVADYEANRHPRLDEYIRRYPRYATEIAAFVSYYYALEVDLPVPAEVPQPLSAATQAAFDQAWKRTEALLPGQLKLFALASRQQIAPEQLASMLNLSLEIVTRLALGQFLPATLPSELLLRLALAVDEPIEQVKEALMPATHQVAEGAMCYTLAHSLASSPSAFRAAIIADPDISATNKGFWLGLLDAQGL